MVLTQAIWHQLLLRSIPSHNTKQTRCVDALTARITVPAQGLDPDFLRERNIPVLLSLLLGIAY